jgi:PAS domain S-box-containing protein
MNKPVLYETGGNQEFISPNIFQLTGYYSEEIRINRDLFPGLINPEDYIETNYKIKNWHKQNEPGILTLNFRFMAANGTPVWIEDHLIGLAKNEFKYMQGMLLDITAQKQKETQLLQLRTEWREKDLIDDRERDSVFNDIERQLEIIEASQRIRHQKAANILNFSKENDVEFYNLDFSFLNEM